MLADLGKALGFKGYTVEVVQGETEIDKHVEKAGKINRGGGAVLLAVEVIPSEKSRVMVRRLRRRPKGKAGSCRSPRYRPASRRNRAGLRPASQHLLRRRSRISPSSRFSASACRGLR